MKLREEKLAFVRNEDDTYDANVANHVDDKKKLKLGVLLQLFGLLLPFLPTGF